MKYKLRRISTFSAARFGCMLGWIVTIIPSLLCGLLSWRLVVVLRDWLQDWEQIQLDLFGFEYVFDLVELLKLKELLISLQTIAGHALPLIVALIIAVGILSGVLIAFTLVLLGWGYNLLAWLTGGIEVELQNLPPRQR